MSSALEHGQIFTSEPMVMRAFAAELRHDLAAAGRLVSAALGENLGPAASIRCEAGDHQNIDILVTFAGGIDVGIEGKIGHSITAEQIAREESSTDGRFILLVKDTADADDLSRERPLPTMLTWSDAFGYFDDPRIGVADVDAVKDEKRIARRALSDVKAPHLGAGWEVTYKDGNGGWPALTVSGPDFADGRYLVLQIEKSRGSETFAAALGISVTSDDFAAFDETRLPEDRPAWMGYADRIGRFLTERLAGTAASLSTGRARRGTRPEGQIKMLQVEHHGLVGSFAMGYIDSYLGVRTRAVGTDDLEAFADVVLASMQDLHASLLRTPLVAAGGSRD